MARATPETRARVLGAIADALLARQGEIIAANREDVAAAKSEGMSDAMLDRLALDEKRIAGVAASVREVIALADVLGVATHDATRPNGLRVRRVRVPLGVIAMIYEARPNATVEATALALKAGNVAVLRGGREAARTNACLGSVIHGALEKNGLPTACVTIVPPTSRDNVGELVRAKGLVDLVVPRGGRSLIAFVEENARVPVIEHAAGVCHMVLDAGADAAMSARLVVNAKLSRPGVCNALEHVLVLESDAARLVPAVVEALVAGGCEVRGDERTRALDARVVPATEEDWGQEYLRATLAMRVVRDLDAALAVIARYGSGHTEAIVTPSAAHAERFRAEVDAACVMVNASTRFHDGGELGLGAELGIATSRVHWRGPMGLEALTTMKWIVDGDGQIR